MADNPHGYTGVGEKMLQMAEYVRGAGKRS
jgi:hypothetical protein